jgi:Type I phosphodiesterase / nucleotide pyrophosphatase
MGAPARVSWPRALRLAAWGVCLFGTFGCVDAAAPMAASPNASLACPMPPEPLPRVAEGHTDAAVIVVLDGARWQDVLVGVDRSLGARLPPSEIVDARLLMPNLHALIERGALVGGPGPGAPMVASGPNFVSLPGYTEIFGGRTPVHCRDNDCPQTQEATIADLTPDAAVFSSWAPIARAASAVTASGPPGLYVSTGQPGTGAFRPDRDTGAAALAHLFEQRPRFLFLGLGEPDEEAHGGDYARYLDALRRDDAILGDLVETLRTMGDRGRRTAVFVTCDHGRSANFRDHGAAWPESSRVWLVAAGGGIPAVGPVTSLSNHHLADIAPTVRALLGLPSDPSPRAGSPIVELFPKEPLDPREARK